MKVTIFVSPENIKNAKRCSAVSCPIALALKERSDLARFGTDWRVRKSHHWGRWVVEAFHGREVFRATELPDNAADFAESFDALAWVFPFSFDLDVPGTGSGHSTP